MKFARNDSARVPFCKMHGLGNDFVLIDARQGTHATNSIEHDSIEHDSIEYDLAMLDSLAVQRIAQRSRGIGFDQLLVMTKPKNKTDAFDMTIFNPDASQAQACGNGTRCAARYVFDHDRTFRRRRTLSLFVAGQRLHAERLSERMIAVEMGVPKFSAEALGLTKPCRSEALALTHDKFGKGYDKPFGVSMGNPHAVFFSEKSDARLKQDLLQHGIKMEKHPLFRFGANISFARAEEGGRAVKLFVWERGAGNTHACGSAACATVVAGVRRGLLQREVCVRMEGGDLDLAWRSDSAPVVMTGPADYAFFGTTHLLA